MLLDQSMTIYANLAAEQMQYSPDVELSDGGLW